MKPPRPLRLRADNFTPATRTPWGGRRILSRYKSAGDLGAEAARTDVVGESWEVSVEPSFPSVIVDSTETLAEHIAHDPTGWLGAKDAARYGQCPLLVKLLDADDNLSVQVHPADGDATLEADESGKPEAWVVLAAEPGSGLYLGFRDGVQSCDVAACIEAGGELDALMTFVPVEHGDGFVIAAGTPHAIGAGVTLLEPQHVTPGRRGLTYRFWDWNRRYDDRGVVDPKGQPRELHIARSLAVTNWDAPRGAAFVASCRSMSTELSAGSLSRHRVIDWPWFDVERWSGTGEFRTATDRLMAITCVAGSLRIATAAGLLQLDKGQSGVVPALAREMVVVAEDGVAFVTTTHRNA